MDEMNERNMNVTDTEDNDINNNNNNNNELQDNNKNKTHEEQDQEQDEENNYTDMSKFQSFKDKGLTGLANLGNTCFMNSTIQCLSHTYELNNFLDKKTYEKHLNKKIDSLAIVEWDKLRELMWSENCVISPGGFLTTIHKLAKIKDKQIFTGFAQNDLPEFLLFIIDCFHEGIKRGVTMNISGNVETQKDALAKKCYIMLKQMYKNDYSEIIRLFYGIHVSQIKSKDETTILRETPEPFFLLNLPIPSLKGKNTYTIQECFNLYTENELLDGENQWFNDETKEKLDVNKCIKFFSLPDILVLDFKRFSNTMKKNNCFIDFPLMGLDLSNYVIGYNRFSYIYDLYGVCNHSGSHLGGHYTAYVKNANGKWYLYNDTNVKEIKNKNDIVSTKAYCLFYRKRQ